MHAQWITLGTFCLAGPPSYRADVQSACGDEAVPPKEVEAVIPGHGKSDNGDSEGIVVGEGGTFGGFHETTSIFLRNLLPAKKLAANEKMTHSLRLEGPFFLGLNAVLGPVSALAHDL
ncbi:hypothetical protein [uncultured Corynebacterium sp.]|uniref:hypothetical protein n=1 Tax=uncultured Corynebacterium sp. TaxID=159447 RepID=UPI002805D19E|nr:hypothetical protein [uncultured Corynebacterium sp.]